MRPNGFGIAGAVINILTILSGISFCFFATYNFMGNGDDWLEILLCVLYVLLGIVTIIRNFKYLFTVKRKWLTILLSLLCLSLIGFLFLLFSEPVKRIKHKQPNGANIDHIINSLFAYKTLLDTQVITENEYKLLKSKLLS